MNNTGVLPNLDELKSYLMQTPPNELVLIKQLSRRYPKIILGDIDPIQSVKNGLQNLIVNHYVEDQGPTQSLVPMGEVARIVNSRESVIYENYGLHLNWGQIVDEIDDENPGNFKTRQMDYLVRTFFNRKVLPED